MFFIKFFIRRKNEKKLISELLNEIEIENNYSKEIKLLLIKKLNPILEPIGIGSSSTSGTSHSSELTLITRLRNCYSDIYLLRMDLLKIIDRIKIK